MHPMSLFIVSMMMVCVCCYPSRADNATTHRERSSQVQPRENYIMGTLHEGMVMERDPATGDSIMRVGPDPSLPQQENGSQMDIEVRPEIIIPVDP